MTRAGTGGALTYKRAYDDAGTLVTEELPGGITRVVTTNALKDDTGLTYRRVRTGVRRCHRDGFRACNGSYAAFPNRFLARAWEMEQAGPHVARYREFPSGMKYVL